LYCGFPPNGRWSQTVTGVLTGAPLLQTTSW